MSFLATLLAAFGGGIFGTMIGGTVTFIVTGLIALAGIGVSLSGGGDILLNEVAFGPVFGPHVAFVGAVAATAFAGRKSAEYYQFQNKDNGSIPFYSNNTGQKFDVQAAEHSGSLEFNHDNALVDDYRTFSISNTLNPDNFFYQIIDNGSNTFVKEKSFSEDLKDEKLTRFNKNDLIIDGVDTSVPLYKTMDPATILVGGIFGVFGYLFNYLIKSVWVIPIDTIALTVVTLGIVVRLLFGKTGFSNIIYTDKKNLTIKKNELFFHVIWGFGLAAAVGYITLLTGFNNFGFAISAFSLIFLYFGFDFPVSHHVSMVAGYAASTFNSVLLGGLFGLFAVVLGEYVLRGVKTQEETYIDMPAIVIASLSIIILGIWS